MKEICNWINIKEKNLLKLVLEVKEKLNCPCVIFLTGDVGMGKTTFTQVFTGNAQGIVLSPTYSLVQEVENVAHADFYRLEKEEEIEYLELDLYLEDKDYFLVEWGISYFDCLKRHLERNFFYYELLIGPGSNGARNFSLRALQ